MIKYNGYYLEEPTKIYNGRSRNKNASYLFNAYLFTSNRNLMICSKHNYIEHLDDFTKDDFNSTNCIHKDYLINENQIVLKASKSYQKDVVLEVISSDKLFNKQGGINLYFISWDRVNDNKNTTIRNLLASLDQNKLKTYYE